MSNVWIVIVNYRTAELAIDCLRSLSTQVDDLAGGRVVVVDNASGDGSVEKLCKAIDHEGWAAWVEVLPLDRNGGFSFGNNAGIRRALSASGSVDYLMMLNPDTVVRPAAVKMLANFMDCHPRAGAAGSQLENAEGGLDSSAHTFPSPLSELDAGARLGLLSRLLRRYVVTSSELLDTAHLCDWVSGASMMIRREVLMDIGWMDENYFLYFEEVDFCCRIHHAGWECWYVPASRIVHLEGASTGIRASAKRRARYWYDSRRRFFVKHYGVSGLVVADILRTIGRFSFVLRKGLHLCTNREDHDPKWFMFDLLWGDLIAILSGQVWCILRTGRQQ
jgi:GT2 family glycosyltransferase